MTLLNLPHVPLTAPRPNAPAPGVSVPGHAQYYAEAITRLHKLENQRANDLLTGAMMQRRFMTSIDAIRDMLHPCGYDAAGFNITHQTVSSDFFSARQTSTDCAALLIGDTAGTSLSSALLSMRIANLVQTTRMASPRDFLTQVHRDISGAVTSGQFVTACHAFIAPGKVIIANAGQPMPLLMRGGRVLEVNASGIPLGLPLGAGQYRNVETTLVAGDRLIFHTDGITAPEKTHTAPASLSGPGLRELLMQHATRSIHKLAEGVAQRLRTIAPHASGTDDMSLLILEYRPGPLASAP